MVINFFVLIILAPLAWVFWRRSVNQDLTGDPKVSLGLGTLSAPGLVVYGFTLTFASFDLLMSNDPHWFSTIYGVYYFSGCVVGFFALLPLLAFLLQRAGRVSVLRCGIAEPRQWWRALVITAANI